MAELNVPAACPPSLVVTPHPVTLEGQKRIAAELLPRETLGHFLARTVPDYGSDAWEVRINGVRVPHQIMDKVRPKGGTVIEVRGTVGRTALLIVAMVALTIFTAGVGTAMVAAGYSAMAAGLAQAAIYAVGSLLINKVLGPKKPKQYESDAATVFTIGSARNQARPYEPLPLVLGNIRMAPDIASQPYSFYEANDQFMALVLTPGINVGRVEAMFNGEALLSTYEGVQVWHSGFPGMPEEKIPLYSNVDTLAGGALEAEKGKPSAWVQRTSSASTIRLQLDFDYMLFDTTSKGKPKDNQETIQVQFRTVGATDWRVFGNFALISQSQKQQRRTYALDVEPGQYEVRARIAGRNTDGKGATSDFTWSTLKSIQTDNASYAGIPRIGVRIKATGQLNGSPDELRCVAYAPPIPVWKGNQWVTEESSNPGAQILAYARGIRDAAGNLIAGLGLLDAQIDIAALQAFMLHCAASKYTYDNVIRDTRSHEDVLQAIALAGFGNVTWAAGRLSVVWAADEQPLSGVVNMATIKKGQFQIDYTLANAADGIEFTYVDRSDWSSKTLRVAAPGVQTMLNPAQVSGEGITSEDHAAKMARYHLAQSLYQYKDISFSTDIEHLSYRRLSVLALQHDLTQWGFGGRLVAAIRNGSSVVLQLDDVVRAPATGNSFIGLRIPGELVYRVFRVANFVGETDQIQLADPWPADAPLPGNTDENPAHDTIWIFDFKQTPGYRVRVVGIEPESDLKGASVSVVPEGPEFWHYVESGEYIRPPNGSLLQTRPVASNLRVTEQQVVQGDTVFTELTATFDVSGPVGEVIVLSDLDGNGELEQVASTRTRTATWRIPQAGVYPITVRPYSPEGNAGVAVTVMYTTLGADAPPVLVDIFDVTEVSGGVRRYTWGFLNDTVQSADFAGVEIRYTAGKVAAPVWDQMTPVGDDGYHSASFEAVLPPAGDWTFACRSRNTSGRLSDGSRVVQKTLGANLGEVIGDLVEDLDEQTARQVEQQRQIDQEKLDRLNADLAESRDRAAAIAQVNANLAQETAFRVEAVKQVADNLTTTTNALAQEKIDRANAVLNEKLEREAAVENLATTTQTQFESVAQQIGSVAAGSGTQFDSAKIWLFNTTTESWTGNGTPTVVDGMLRPANSTSAYAQTPSPLTIDGNAYRFIKTRIKRVGSPTWRGLVRWITDADTTWNDAKSVTLPAPSFDAGGIATVDISDIPWNGASPIRAVRMALVTTQTDAAYLLYDYVAIGRPSPGASVALVQEVQTALQQADQVVAQSVTTLGAQMRGQYTGTDPLQLTSGLMYQEMVARADADKAQVQRIGTMEARMPAGAGRLATSAQVTALEEATATNTSALAQSITTINAKLPALISQGSNMVLDGSFELGEGAGWTYAATPSVSIAAEGRTGKCLKVTGAAGTRTITANGGANLPVINGRKYRIGAHYQTDADYNGSSGNGKVRIGNQDGGLIAGLAFAAGRTEWTRVETVVTATTIAALRLNIVCDHTAGVLRVDDVVIEEVTDVLANAEGLQALTTTVQNQGGQISSQAGLISALRTDVDGKASNAALQTLQSQVTLQGNDITSLGTAITNVSASLGNVGGDNELANSSFEAETSSASQVPGWSNNSGGMTGQVSRRTWNTSTLPGSARAWRWELDNVPATSYLEAVSNGALKTAKVVPGQKHTLSTYVRGTPGARYFLQIAWRAADNSTISYTGLAGNQLLTSENWERKSFTTGAAAPANAVRADAYLRIYGNNTMGQYVEWDNVQLEVGDVASGYKASLGELQQQISANAAATTTLTGTVTTLQGTVTALGQSVTTVNAKLDGLRTLGDNMAPNSNFAAGLQWWSVGGSPLPAWTETAGDSRPGVTMTKTGSSNPSLTVADGQWIPNRGARRYRAIVRAMGVSGAMNLMLRLQRQNRETLAAGNNDKQLTLSSSFATYTVDFDAVDASIGAVRLWAYNYPNNAVVRVDSIELYDVTEQLAAEANAAATATLTGTVTQQGQQITAQGSAITSVSAAVDQGNRAGSNMVLDGSFEARAVGTAIHSWATVTAGGRTGANALTVTHASNTRSIQLATFDVAPDRVYYCEAWAKRVGPAAGNVQLRFQLSDNGASQTYPNFSAPNLSTFSETEWTKVSGYVRIAAGKNRAILQLNSSSSTTSATQLIWDDFVLQDVTEAYNAQQTAAGAASGVSALQATVTQQGQDITAQASRIDGVQASVGGKADAAVVQEMRVQASNKAEGGNLLANSTFQSWNRRTWGWYSNGQGWQELGNPTGTDYWNPPGVYGMGSVRGGVLANDVGDYFGTEYMIPVQAGRTYCLSYYASTHRCKLFLYIEFYDEAGNIISTASAQEINNTNTNPVTLNSLARPFAIGVAPANAKLCRVIGLVRGIGQDSPYFWIFRPMLSEVPAGCTAPPAWEAGNQSAAEWNLSVQANGISAGLQLGVTGQTSAFNILASAVNILTPGGADGFELTNGYLRVWSGNSQRIIGNGFGGDGLVDYFGPNVGAANANKSNATMWMDRNGNAYWGGSIAAGILRNAAQATTTQTIGTSVLVGPFDTNGRNKQVVVGFNRRHIRRKSAMGSQGFVAGAGSNGGVINLYRQLTGQAETLWQQIQITGSVDIRNEKDGPDIADSVWNASVTLNDSGDGTTRRSYRAEIVSFTEQNVTHQSGSFDSQNITQSLSIVSIEQ